MEDAFAEFLRRQNEPSPDLPQASATQGRFVTIEIFGGLSPVAMALHRRNTPPSLELYIDNDPVAQAVVRYNLPFTSIWNTW